MSHCTNERHKFLSIVSSSSGKRAVIGRMADRKSSWYDSSITLADNVELMDPILQRFDVICVLQDEVDPIADEHMAKFVTSRHMNAHHLLPLIPP